MEVMQRKQEILLMFDYINQIYILLSVMKELKLFLKKNDYENLLEHVETKIRIKQLFIKYRS